MPRPRLVFLGSPAFAVPALHAAQECCDIPLVLTQPDRPAGRGRQPLPTAVRVAAEELGLTVRTYVVRERQAVTAALATMHLDVLLVVAFGHILKPALLQTARCGAVNVHASLLPRWRGSSPIEQAILAGDRVSGVTLMQLDEGVDTGPMIASRQVVLAGDETRLTLHDKLAAEGAQLVRESLLPFLSGRLPPRPQPQESARHAPRLEKRDGLLRWQNDALALERQVRAFQGWPGCFTLLQGENLKVHAARALGTASDQPPGTIVAPASLSESGCAPGQLAKDAVVVACGRDTLQLLEVQLPGKRRVAASDLLRSGRLRPGTRFDSDEVAES